VIQRSRCGEQGFCRFGESGRPRRQDQILGQLLRCRAFGEIVAAPAAKREEVLIARCDLGKIEETRRSWPFLRDRRIDAMALNGALAGR
jgi:N-carbamoylputrescine amidase